ncbi:hypothetical protein [Aequorivita antarctica]|uniref:Uncharacterized protein n=1 Tax=Aequorivita antarctica TaxID=153266 RepID=A0A5C6Z2R8_9FLAO|nr:hypothetical protein [Aequorivita antarctica]TXD74437.1 hypothetical protein ESU54_04085 [Aequorivita antarctica]SRX73796.1 hypothetical protein AEQU3_01231 [Aequorivita antarctica]
MKIIFIIMIFSLVASSANAQDCFDRLQEAFDTRGANPVADGMHRNVYISYFEDGASRCISGKVRVEDSKIVSVFLQYDYDTYELMDAKF